jgi:carbonic anhydrase/acetyltransferase-like protein (isoleucine patch superfamily)
VSETAILIGDVGSDKAVTSVMGVIQRGDYGTIEIGDEATIEEGLIVHAPSRRILHHS